MVDFSFLPRKGEGVMLISCSLIDVSSRYAYSELPYQMKSKIKKFRQITTYKNIGLIPPPHTPPLGVYILGRIKLLIML